MIRMTSPGNENNKGFLRLAAGIGIPLAVAFVGFAQTSFFGRFLPGFDNTLIRSHIKECRALQGPLPETPIQFESFEPEQPELEQRLKNAINSFTQDTTLNGTLRNAFGEDFRDLNVIIIPSWVISSEQKADLYGITLEGWNHIAEARNSAYVGAYTLRNRPSEEKVTKDGRTRIIINPSALQSESALRLTLFHELLHALNIPGRDPPWYGFAQDDLRYLPEYRDEVWRQGWIMYSQACIWVLAVCVPLGIALAPILRYVIRKRASRG